jgi:hypothetical protein
VRSHHDQVAPAFSGRSEDLRRRVPLPRQELHVERIIWSVELTQTSLEGFVFGFVATGVLELDDRLAEINRLLQDPVWLDDMEDEQPSRILDRE